MFKVIVLACSVFNPTECYEYSNTRGAYASYELCAARAEEMREAILELNEGRERPQAFRCVKLEGQKL